MKKYIFINKFMLPPKYFDYLLEHFNIEIYLIRHGQSENNHLAKLCRNGTLFQKFKYRNYYKDKKYKDCHLTDQGIFESIQLGNNLNFNNIKFDHIFCSPLNRCIETCYYAMKNHEKEQQVIINEHLREIISSIGDYPYNLLQKQKDIKKNLSCVNFSFYDSLRKNPDGEFIEPINEFKKRDQDLYVREHLEVKENAYIFWCYLITKLYEIYFKEKNIQTKDKEKKTLKIGIYSHCGFISLFEREVIKYYFSNNIGIKHFLNKIKNLRNTDVAKLEFSKNNKNGLCMYKKKTIYNRNYKLKINLLDFQYYFI